MKEKKHIPLIIAMVPGVAFAQMRKAQRTACER